MWVKSSFFATEPCEVSLLDLTGRKGAGRASKDHPGLPWTFQIYAGFASF